LINIKATKPLPGLPF